MYPLFISAGLATSVLLCCLLIPEEPFYFSGPFLAVVTFLPTFILLSRKIGDKIQPFFAQAQRQAQAGSVPQAIESFEKALAYKRWQLYLEKQVNTQVGILLYATGEEKKAIERLKNGYPKLSEGHMVLGAALYRDGQTEEAIEALRLGIRFNKKSPVLYNFLAWLLDKEGKTEEAITVLQGGLKPLKDDEETAHNLKRLQNKKPPNMKPFGQLWYMLRFETPPGMAQGQPFRKGFRQPPKAGKKQKKDKKKAKRR